MAKGGSGRKATSKGYVDYEENAALYRRGRALSPEVLGRWGEAVRTYLPSAPIRVADVGAGTGIFVTCGRSGPRHV